MKQAQASAGGRPRTERRKATASAEVARGALRRGACRCAAFVVHFLLVLFFVQAKKRTDKFDDPEGMYFVTLSIVGWVDLFIRPELKHIVIDSLKYCQQHKGLIIHAWCLMPSHLHMINSTSGPPLSSIFRDFKKFTASQLIKEISSPYESRRDWILELFGEVAERLERVRNYKVWQDGNHPVLLYSNKFIQQKLIYIHKNPVVAEFVENPEDYLYSSARDYYCDKEGLLEISMI